jgi:hypothetical protein
MKDDDLKDDEWKQDTPELNFESHSKGSKFLCSGSVFLQTKNLKTCFRFVIMRYCV